MTSVCQPLCNEEQKVLNSKGCLRNLCVTGNTTVITTPNISTSISTENVLESMEDCVSCINGIEEQRTFEESLRDIVIDHGLNKTEVALSRIQIIDLGSTSATGIAADSAPNGIHSAKESIAANIIHPQLDVLLAQVCGGRYDSSISDDRDYKVAVDGDGVISLSDIVNDDPLSADLCNGVISPTDTTLPTSLPGNELVNSKLEMSDRSLIDMVTESDALQEHLEGELESTLEVEKPIV